MVGFHILGNAAQTPSSKTDPCTHVERGFVIGLLVAWCKLRRAGKR